MRISVYNKRMQYEFNWNRRNPYEMGSQRFCMKNERLMEKMSIEYGQNVDFVGFNGELQWSPFELKYYETIQNAWNELKWSETQ